MELLHFKTVL